MDGRALGRTGSPVRDKSYAFALRTVRLVRELKRHREYELASQVLRSGTSIGSNVEEAEAASSRADFVAKLAISAREARETRYWLNLLRDSETLDGTEVEQMLGDVHEIICLLTRIIKTTRATPKPA